MSGRAGRLYRRLLWLAPASLRRRYRAEMEELFLHALTDARRHGGSLAVLAVWLHAVRDLVAARARHLLTRAAPASASTPTSTSASTSATAPARASAFAFAAPSRSAPPPRYDTRSSLMLDSDFRYALRSLLRQKSSALLVIAMLALGIAANIAVFSFVNGLFLRPFPFSEPDRLVYINEKAPRWNLDEVSIKYLDFQDWRQGVRTFDSLALYSQDSFNLSGDGRAERIRGASVTYDLAQVLRISPLIGRLFTRDDDRPKAAHVVLIGEQMWRERFNADAGVIGRPLRLDGEPYTIIGVLPREADFPGDVALWVPLVADPVNAGPYMYDGIGRLKAGVTVDEAERDLLHAHEPSWRTRDTSKDVSPFVRPLHQQMVRDFSSIASTLLTGVALLLIIACANVASVMLARTLARRREMATRLALGASRGRLVRQLFVENLVLAAIGGGIGFILGQWAIRLLVATLPERLPRWATFGGDARLIAFAIGASVLTVLLFGWAPALHAIRGDLRSAVQDVTKGTTASPRGRVTLWCLVAAEFAMAALLLVCGGLLLRSFDRVRQVDPGFRTDHVLLYRVALPDASYKDDAARVAFWQRLLARMRELPGVQSAGVVSCPPLGCHSGYFLTAEGHVRAPGEASPVVLLRMANPSYFEAMGIRLRSGRFFEEGENQPGAPGQPSAPDAPRSIIVNETFAKAFWPDGSDPVGRRVRFGDGTRGPWVTVVGVVHDIKHYGLERPMRPGVYIPLVEGWHVGSLNSLSVVLHTSVDPQSMVAATRAAMTALDPELPMYQVQTMEAALHDSMQVRATYSWLLAAFAGIAFVLALGGAYGVASYLVSQRTREIGIRVALGARHADIARTVVGRGLAVVAIGVAIGLAASFGAARVMSGLLFETGGRDVVTLAVVSVALMVTALVAQLLPARRAARIDPMQCLRQD